MIPNTRSTTSRLTPEKLDTATDDEMYWAVRTNVIFRHTGELPIEISGPDAETLLNKVFTRSVSKVKPGRCSYQFACYHDGGMITDGVLLRLVGRQVLDGAGRRRPVQLVQGPRRGARRENPRPQCLGQPDSGSTVTRIAGRCAGRPHARSFPLFRLRRGFHRGADLLDQPLGLHQ